MQLNRDFGGSLPTVPALENPGPARSREDSIFNFIRLALEDGQAHSGIVQSLIKRLYASGGNNGYIWLKQYYERELSRLKIQYQAKNDELGVKIDQINKRLAK